MLEVEVVLVAHRLVATNLLDVNMDMLTVVLRVDF
jgi:hypothetical protein